MKINKTLDFLNVKTFNNVVRKTFGHDPHLVHFTYDCGPDICDYGDSQYIETSCDFLINKQENSEYVASRAFNAINIYPVFQAYCEGRVNKLGMTMPSLGRLEIEIKGYLIDRGNK